VDVAAKALAASPDDRWATAPLMAAELRKAAGLKLAPVSTAAAFAKGACGERVKKRHEVIESGAGTTTSPKPPPVRAPLPTSPQSPQAREAAASPAPSVVVAPGLRAPVAEVVELGSDFLTEAPLSSIPPPPAGPSSAVGGRLIDPFAAARATADPKSPPVIAAQPVQASEAEAVPISIAPEPLSIPPEAISIPPDAISIPPEPISLLPEPLADEGPPPPSITGSPHFAAAIDLVQPRLPPPVEAHIESPDPFQTSPSVAGQAEDAELGVRQTRRRKLLVLGGVGALGVLIAVLAAVRVAGRSGDSGASAVRPPPSAAATQASAPSPPPVAAAAPPAPHTAEALPPAPSVAFTAPPPAAVAAPPPATAPKPRPKPTFDPNSL
jgi:hypothetical protein